MHSSNVHKLAAVASLLAASNALSSNSHLEARDAEPIRPQVKDGFMRVGNGIKNVGGAFMGGLGQGLSGRDVEAILAAREADAEFEELYSIYARDAEPEDFGYYESVYARNADPSFKSWIKGAAPKIEKTVGTVAGTAAKMFIRDAEPEELDYLEAVYARDAQPGKKGQMAGKVFNNIASGLGTVGGSFIKSFAGRSIELEEDFSLQRRDAEAIALAEALAEADAEADAEAKILTKDNVKKFLPILASGVSNTYNAVNGQRKRSADADAEADAEAFEDPEMFW